MNKNKYLPDKLKNLILLEFPKATPKTQDYVIHDEVSITRFLYDSIDVAKPSYLKNLGKDDAWTFIEKNAYREELYNMACLCLITGGEGMRDVFSFITKNKYRLDQ